MTVPMVAYLIMVVRTRSCVPVFVSEQVKYVF